MMEQQLLLDNEEGVNNDHNGLVVQHNNQQPEDNNVNNNNNNNNRQGCLDCVVVVVRGIANSLLHGVVAVLMGMTNCLLRSLSRLINFFLYSFCFPVFYGRPMNEEDRGRDGYVSSLSFLTIFLSFTFSVSIAAFLLDNEHMSYLYLDIMLVTLQVIGLVIITLFFACGLRRGIENRGAHDEQHRRGGMATTLQNNLPLIGMVLFAFVASLLNLLQVVAYFSCDTVWRQCGANTYIPYIVSNLKDLIGIVFIWMSVSFCIVFHSLNLKRSCLIRHGLVGTLVAVLALWFDSILNDSTLHSKEQVRWHDNCNWTNATPAEVDHKELCFNMSQSIPEFEFLDKFLPYLYPFVSEFALLVSECILHLFFGMNDHHNQDHHEEPPRHEDLHANNEVVFNQPTVKLWRTLGGITAIVANVVLSICGFLTYIQHSDNTVYIKAFSICKVFYFIALIIATICGVYCITQLKRKQLKIKGLEYLLILTSSGSFFYLFSSLYADVYCLKEPSEHVCSNRELVIFDVLQFIFIFLQITVQLPFMLLASRVHEYEPDDVNQNVSSAAVKLKTVILGIAISNGFIWAINSFVEIRNVQTQSIQAEYYGDGAWHWTQHITMPLAIFFRFNSTLILLKAYYSLKITN